MSAMSIPAAPHAPHAAPRAAGAPRTAHGGATFDPLLELMMTLDALAECALGRADAAATSLPLTAPDGGSQPAFSFGAKTGRASLHDAGSSEDSSAAADPAGGGGDAAAAVPFAGLALGALLGTPLKQADIADMDAAATRPRGATPAPGGTAPSAAQPPAVVEAPPAHRLWNIQELAHRIRVAMETSGAPTPGPAAEAANPAAKAAGGAPLRGHAGESLPAQLPAAGGAGANAKDPAAQAGRPAAETNAERHGAEPSSPVVALPGHRVEWSARPVAAGDAATRAPRLVEQIQQVADFLALRAEGVVRLGDRGVEANLRLYPPDLGGVRVLLIVRADHTAQAQFIVERPETALLLQEHMNQFRESLGRHGLAVERVQVTGPTRAVAPAADAMPAWNDRADHAPGQWRRPESEREETNQPPWERQWDEARQFDRSTR